MGAPPAEIAVNRLCESVSQIRSASEVRRYRLGAFRAVVFTDVETTGTVRILHAVAVFEHKDAPPVLVLFAEERKGAGFYGTGSHAMICLEKGRRSVLGDNDAYSSCPSFETKALEIAGSRLGVTDAPKRVRPRDPNAPKRTARDAPDTDSNPGAPQPSRRTADVPVPSSQTTAGVGVLGAAGAVLLVIKLLLKIGVTAARPMTNDVAVPANYRYHPSTGVEDRSGWAPPKSIDPIALDDRDVYWASHIDACIYARDKGGGETRVVAGSAWSTNGLAVDGEYVYFTFSQQRADSTEAGVYRVAKGGGSPERMHQSLSQASSPVLRNGALFLVEGVSFEGLLGERATFSTCTGIPLDGGAPVAYVSQSELSRAIAVDDSYVYWVPWQSGRVEFAAVSRGARPAKPPKLALPQADAGAGSRVIVEVAVDDTSLYLDSAMNNGEFAIEKLPKSGRKGIVLATSPWPLDGLTIRGGEVWWVQREADAGGAIYRSAGKQAPVRVVEGLPQSARMAVDDRRVYWTTDSGMDSLAVSTKPGDAGVRERGLADAGQRCGGAE